MKWKDLRQSTNVEDKTNENYEIPEGEILYPTGETYHKPVSYSPDDIAVAKELGRLNKEKKTPIPTPRPLNIIKTQVTPGKWVTK